MLTRSQCGPSLASYTRTKAKHLVSFRHKKKAVRGLCRDDQVEAVEERTDERRMDIALG